MKTWREKVLALVDELGEEIDRRADGEVDPRFDAIMASLLDLHDLLWPEQA